MIPPPQSSIIKSAHDAPDYPVDLDEGAARAGGAGGNGDHRRAAWPKKQARRVLLLPVADEICDGAAIRKSGTGGCQLRPVICILANGPDHGRWCSRFVLDGLTSSIVTTSGYAISRSIRTACRSSVQPMPLHRCERITLKCLLPVMG